LAHDGFYIIKLKNLLILKVGLSLIAIIKTKTRGTCIAAYFCLKDHKWHKLMSTAVPADVYVNKYFSLFVLPCLYLFVRLRLKLKLFKTKETKSI
jgi:hypothetical protein